MKDPAKPYEIYVDDNFAYMDESKRSFEGAYGDCATAIARCKAIVEDWLRVAYREGMTAEELWSSYEGFGEDPWIASPDKACTFSAWTFAKARCEEIARGQSS
jgi:hypothetical protein